MAGSSGDLVVLAIDGRDVELSSHAALGVFDPDGRIIDVNDAWVRQYGWTREEARAMAVTDVSVDAEKTRATIAEALRVGGAIVLRWHRRKDGTRFPVEIIGGTIRGSDRVVLYTIINDVSDRLSKEGALVSSEARFRDLIEAMPDAVLVHRRGLVVYMNAAGRRIFGFPENESIVGKSALELIHPDDRARVAGRMRATIDGARVPPIEERIIRADGTSLTLEVAAIPTTFDGEQAVLAIGRDVTARREMEAKLVMGDRLAALGRLAASVGHEINNPLAYVLGNVELLRREIERAEAAIPGEIRDRLVGHLDVLENGAVRVRDIVRDLRTLSRGDTDASGAVELTRVLDVCASMAEHELRHRARLVKRYERSARVRSTEARLGQIFLNLLVNAAQAIPEGDVDHNEVTIAVRSAGHGAVAVEITDSGAGIPPEILDRIFEPFFTTKALGGGTGLGLSICHHLVASLGGTIAAENASPRGTRFRVVLPTTDEDEPATSRHRSVPVDAPEVRKVLVVDDERRVAEVIAEMLERTDVVVATSGREAIAKIAADPSFDVVLCDVRMGDGTGLEAFEHVKTHHPPLADRFAFMTGGGLDAVTRAALRKTGRPCIEKPFSAEDLRRAIASARPR